MSMLCVRCSDSWKNMPLTNSRLVGATSYEATYAVCELCIGATSYDTTCCMWTVYRRNELRYNMLYVNCVSAQRVTIQHMLSVNCVSAQRVTIQHMLSVNCVGATIYDTTYAVCKLEVGRCNDLKKKCSLFVNHKLIITSWNIMCHL
jgi:hypothetical protein